MDHAIDEGAYLLEEVELELDSDSEDEYITVSVEDVAPKPKTTEEIPTFENLTGERPTVTKLNEVVDDYVRNFLKKMGMVDTLSTFQREWYAQEHNGPFRDLAEEIEDKRRQIKEAEAEKLKWQQVSEEVQMTWDRLKQERNYHREGLEAVQKEKADLIADLEKLKKTKKRLDPAIQELQARFEHVHKERAMLRIERDRLQAEIAQMQKGSGPQTD